MLASLAPDGSLVISRAAHAALLDPSRVLMRDFDSPAFQALSEDTVPHGIVTGIDPSYEERIAKASRTAIAN